MKKRVWLIFKIMISLALILLILMRVDLFQLGREVKNANIFLILFSIIIGLMAYAVNTYKWRELLLILKTSIPFLTLLALNFIGFFYTLFLSTQISGEVIKAIKLTKLKKNASHVIASITMDRLTSLLALIFISFPSIVIGAVPLFKDLRLMWWALAIMLIVVLVMIPILNRRVSMSFERFSAYLFKIKGLDHIKRFVSPTWNSFKAYQDHLPALGAIFIYSFIYQLLIMAVNYFIALSIGIQISFINLIWIVGVVSILQLLPLSIAGIGVREGAFLVILERYGVLYPKALAFSLIVFGVNLLMGLIGGGIEIISHFKK